MYDKVYKVYYENRFYEPNIYLVDFTATQKHIHEVGHIKDQHSRDLSRYSIRPTMNLLIW